MMWKGDSKYILWVFLTYSSNPRWIECIWGTTFSLHHCPFLENQSGKSQSITGKSQSYETLVWMFKVSLGWIASRLFFLLKLSQKQKLAVEKAEGEDVQDPGKIRKLVGEREKEREMSFFTFSMNFCNMILLKFNKILLHKTSITCTLHDYCFIFLRLFKWSLWMMTLCTLYLLKGGGYAFR